MDAPAAAVSADGKLIAVAWMDMRRGPDERDVFWRRIEAGKVGKSEALGDPQGPQGHAALALDDKGVVHAVWESDGAILYLSSAGGEPKPVSTEKAATQPSLAWRDGVLLVAYEWGGRIGAASVVKRVE
jgi:hypothetical protein